MSDRIGKNPQIRVRKLHFPWPSALGAVLAVAYLLFTTEPGLIAFYEIPAEWSQAEVRYSVLGIFVLLLLFDLRRYHSRYAKQKADLERIGRQLEDLWSRNRQLQLKAHTYSGHADKLKLFISDKLLDYIEYDEKFLHFKGIASEVRHNGVISFDKVQTALQRAAAASRASESAANPAAEYESALDAMRYLWDLLDLSTVDNLALHIGNLMCECEEQYCQRLLDVEEHAPLPYEPVYSPQLAAWRALGGVHPDRPAMPEEGKEYRFDDGHWSVHLAPVGDLLGNENHLVLLLDNLLKNAQFFSRKRRGKAGIAPVALTLHEDNGHAVVRVYNRGPHILEDDPARLFQLGYSTRRSRQHHGRGLGLYFVNEIVRGYEGRIGITNINTPETRYELRLTLANGEVITHDVEVTRREDGRPQCKVPVDQDIPETGDGIQVRKSVKWALPAALQKVEIIDQSAPDDDCRLDQFEGKGKQSCIDPAHPVRPHWRLIYQPGRKKPALTFEPLDIHGVEFEIQLPTAQHRLESGEAALDKDIDAEVERLDEHFRVLVR